MKKIRTYASLLALAGALLLIVAACGGSSDSGAGASAPSGSSAATVSVGTADDVGKVLVDSNGAALYAADQEVGGMVLCNGSCTTEWKPLTLSAGEKPIAGNGVRGKLGVLTRPDGARQVTFDGRLLYRFDDDPGPGAVTGNGFADTFAGRAFTWHVATPTGISSSSKNSSSSGDGYGY